MADLDIDIEGLDKVREKFKDSPKAIERNMKKAMYGSLLYAWEHVPRYPAVGTKTNYIRTGTLGRSLGVMQGGGKVGNPSIYKVDGGPSNMQGQFGTNLSYARYVIDADDQAYMHKKGYKGRQGWWTMTELYNKVKGQITKIWEDFIDIAMKS